MDSIRRRRVFPGDAGLEQLGELSDDAIKFQIFRLTLVSRSLLSMIVCGHGIPSSLLVTNQEIVEFDEGHLKDDPVKAQKELDAHMAILEDKNPPVQRDDNPIHYVFQTTWDRFKKVRFHLLQVSSLHEDLLFPENITRVTSPLQGIHEGLL